MKSYKQFITEVSAKDLQWKRIETDESPSGKIYAIAQRNKQFIDPETKQLKLSDDLEYAIMTIKQNYSGNVRGGMKKSWAIMNNNKNPKGIVYDTIDDADKQFKKLLKK